MTFATRLEELRNDATEENHVPWASYRAEMYLKDYLVNHSADILALVKACEEFIEIRRKQKLITAYFFDPQEHAITAALSKLNQE